MGFLSEGLEPLKQAQDEVLLRLDAMLVELHTMTEVLYEVRSLLAAGAVASGDRGVMPVSGNGNG